MNSIFLMHALFSWTEKFGTLSKQVIPVIILWNDISELRKLDVTLAGEGGLLRIKCTALRNIKVELPALSNA